MGGPGSGRRCSADRRSTVEEALVLPVDDLVAEHAPRPGQRVVGVWEWAASSPPQRFSGVKYDLEVLEPSRARLRLVYRCLRTQVVSDVTLRLVSTDMPRGGLRWWFVCPLKPKGLRCRRRVGKLYLPPGARHPGCRHCHELTYRSCQAPRRPNRLFCAPSLSEERPGAAARG